MPGSLLGNRVRRVEDPELLTGKGTFIANLALVPGTPSSLGGAIAWIAGLLAVFIPLSVWRYRRMT